MNSTPPRTLVLIPAYNEAPELPAVLEAISRSLPGCDRLVIDDGSTDTTAAVARESGTTVVSHLFNMGYGTALQTGYKYAVLNGYRFILQMDADGQHDARYLPDLLAVLASGEADVVIGSRRLGESAGQWPFIRRAGMKVFSMLTSLCTGQRITDPTSGFKGFEQTTFSFLTSDYFPDDYPDADVIIMLNRLGFRIREIPVTMKPPAGEQSMHSGIKPLYYIFKMTFSILLTLLRTRKQEKIPCR